MRKVMLAAAMAATVLGVGARQLFAHSAICNCYANEDRSITCEGGFSDGSSAKGLPIRVLDLRDRVLIDGKLDDKSTFSFPRPTQDFRVVLDAGGGHVVTVESEDIE